MTPHINPYNMTRSSIHVDFLRSGLRQNNVTSFCMRQTKDYRVKPFWVEVTVRKPSCYLLNKITECIFQQYIRSITSVLFPLCDLA